MSLLYECINGLLSGGILVGLQDTDEADELASVCVNKLREFLVEGDSNLKYVGLLALAKLVNTHGHLVGLHKDVILDCIDDPDISIRYNALELVVGMVNPEILPSVVGRLIRQLKTPKKGVVQDYVKLEGSGDLSEEDMEEQVMHPHRSSIRPAMLELSDEYKRIVIARILDMCKLDMYVNVADFEWYLDVLLQLVRFTPFMVFEPDLFTEETEMNIEGMKDVTEDIGRELRNVAVRVRSMRPQAVRSAEILVGQRGGISLSAGGGRRVLYAAGWIVGEYATYVVLDFCL